MVSHTNWVNEVTNKRESEEGENLLHLKIRLTNQWRFVTAASKQD